MKAFILCALLTLACQAEEPIWSDEFDGNALNTQKWVIDTNTRHSGTNSKEAIVVKDGCLHINTSTVNGKHYTGFISTEGKFEAKQGRWVVRVKFDDQPGTWSCAWLYTKSAGESNTDRNKYGMEIDIFEHRLFDMNRKDISGVVNHTLHWNGYDKWHQYVSTDTPIRKNEFNVYELKWTDKSYEFYVNGHKTFTSFEVTTKPLYFILSTEIGYLDFWTQPLLDEYKHTTMTVDYVRYYSK